MLSLEPVRGWFIARARSLAFGAAIVAIGIFGFHVLRRSAGFWTIDDSAVTYSAAFELVDHHSLAPYVEGTPIESYSNPLLFFVTAVIKLVAPFDPIATHIYLEAIVFGVLLLLVWLVLRALASDAVAIVGTLAFGAVELATPATWVWYGSGLENVWVSAGLVALVWLSVRTARGMPLAPGWGVLAGAVALLRPEAPVYVAAFYVTLVALARPLDEPWGPHVRRIAVAAGVTAGVFAAFLMWRRLAYHAWLPNTYYAKVPGHGTLKEHFVDEILGSVLPYRRAGLFAASAIALMLRDATERVGQILLAMLVAALTMPLVGGADWMGDVRFGTPFIAVAHLAWASLLAVCLARARRPSAIFTAVVVALVGLLLKWDGVRARPPQLNTVTTDWIGEKWGVRRWESQMRHGVPYPVLLDPDIGGALFVGGIQLVDSGMLGDYQMAHMGYDPSSERAHQLATQYELAERTPDLIDDNFSWPLDFEALVAQYDRGVDGIWARKDLVDAPVPADARLLLTDGNIAVHLSSGTVTTAAPGALVRIEVYVTWTNAPARRTVLRASLPTDEDELSIVTHYKPADHGSIRTAFLIGMPHEPGTHEVQLALARPGLPALPGVSIPIEVVAPAEADRRAAVLAEAGTPLEAARRVAWLREQQVPRLSMIDFRYWQRQLHDEQGRRSKLSGAPLRAMRENAELAELRGVTPGIRAAELVAIRRVLATCAPGTDATRALCLGHAVDNLRRLGYLGVLERVPAVASELTDLRDRSAQWPAEPRYRALVGVVLADPSDLAAQRALIDARAAVATFPPL